MRIQRAMATAAVLCLALGGLAACGDDGNGSGGGSGGGTGGPGGFRHPEPSNGVEKLTAQQISDKAKDALKSAHSLRAVAASEELNLDLTMDRDGNCAGTVSQGSDGGKATIIKRGDWVWMKGDHAFWEKVSPSKADSIEAVLGDRYVKASTSDSDFGFDSDTCDLGSMSSSLDNDSGDNKVTKAGITTVNGVRCVQLKGTDTDGPTDIYVSTVGKPYPVKLAGTDHGKPVALTFTDYDKPVPTSTPSADQTLDAEKLKALQSS
jgi:hypothetical protein